MDVAGLHLRRGHRLEVEEGEPHRRGDEGHVEVDGHHHREPHHQRSHQPQGFGGGDEQGHHDEGDLQELEVDPQQEDDDVGGDDEAPLVAGDRGQPFGDQVLAVEPVEHQGEEGGGEEDLKNQSGDVGRRPRRVEDGLPLEVPVEDRQQHRSQGTHGTGFGGGGDPGEDRAEDGKDEEQRRYHHPHGLQGEFLGCEIPFLLGDGRGHVRFEPGEDQGVEGEDRRQHDPGDEGPGEQLTHRDRDELGEDDQHQGGWDELGQGPRGDDHPRRQLGIVFVSDHHRQGEESHDDHRGRHHPGGRGEERSHDDHRHRHPAAQRPHEQSDGLEQTLGKSRLLEDSTHEDEEGNRQEGEVGDRVGEPLAEEDVQGAEGEIPEEDPQQEEHHTGTGEGEGHRVSAEDHHQEDGEHDDGQQLDAHLIRS